jgi:hypothetical protein
MASQSESKVKVVCERLEKCVFFNNLSLPAVGDALKMLYCKGKYQTCARYQLANQGQPVPIDLWPDGKKQ